MQIFFYQSCLDLVRPPLPFYMLQIFKTGGMSKPIEPDLVKKWSHCFNRVVGGWPTVPILCDVPKIATLEACKIGLNRPILILFAVSMLEGKVLWIDRKKGRKFRCSSILICAKHKHCTFKYFAKLSPLSDCPQTHLY